MLSGLMMKIVPALFVMSVMSLIEIRRTDQILGRLLNLQIWLVDIAAATLIGFVAFSLPRWSLLPSDALPFWLALPAFVLMSDLTEYALHRLEHAVPFFWRIHSLHHSDPDMNASTTFRHHWSHSVLRAALVTPFAWAIIRPTPAIFMINLAIGMWVVVCHSSANFSFGRLSWLLNSSAYHRRHHSALPEHFNSNYANIFPIWDLLFGSYHQPRGKPPTGLSEHPKNIWQALPLPPSA